MKVHWDSMVQMVHSMDKNIKDTEKLLDSFLPNVNALL